MLNRFYGIILLVLLVVGLLTSCEKSEEVIHPDLEETVDVHIIMGQSNGLGFGEASELPAHLQEPLEGAYIFNSAIGQFETLHAGVNTQSPAGQFGAVVKAAQLLRDHKKEDVYFIVAAISGTQLHNSGSQEIPDWHPDSNELLAQSKQVIEKARAALVASGKTPVFKSIAWWQGERDAMDETMANAYQQNEQAFFGSLDKVEYLKDTRRVVFKIFTDVEDLVFSGEVNAAKANRAAADPRTIKLIETNGYERKPQDRVHANANGLVQAGTDLYNVIRGL